MVPGGAPHVFHLLLHAHVELVLEVHAGHVGGPGFNNVLHGMEGEVLAEGLEELAAGLVQLAGQGLGSGLADGVLLEVLVHGALLALLLDHQLVIIMALYIFSKL